MDLFGAFNPSEKYEFVNWDDDIPNIWKNEKCSKPPTRFGWCELNQIRHHFFFWQASDRLILELLGLSDAYIYLLWFTPEAYDFQRSLEKL